MAVLRCGRAATWAAGPRRSPSRNAVSNRRRRKKATGREKAANSIRAANGEGGRGKRASFSARVRASQPTTPVPTPAVLRACERRALPAGFRLFYRARHVKRLLVLLPWRLMLIAVGVLLSLRYTLGGGERLEDRSGNPQLKDLEVVADLPLPPGNIAVS